MESYGALGVLSHQLKRTNTREKVGYVVKPYPFHNLANRQIRIQVRMFHAVV